MNQIKIRFFALSVILISVCYLLSVSFLLGERGQSQPLFIRYTVIIALLSILGSLVIQYLSGGEWGVQTVVYTGIMPFLLVFGCFLFFIYYPNLSVIIKIFAGMFNVGLLYTLLLLNNVVLVVKSREVTIPIYRVAVNWVQIILLSMTLTLITGTLKATVQPLLQVIAIVGYAYIFYFYLIWVYSHDGTIRAPRSFERLTLCSAASLLVGWSASFTLFFSAESFLRGIFVASVFLLGLGYIQLYLKNAVSKKSIWEYSWMCLVFLIILVAFRP